MAAAALRLAAATGDSSMRAGGPQPGARQAAHQRVDPPGLAACHTTSAEPAGPPATAGRSASGAPGADTRAPALQAST
ncbi:hypothetical protein DCC79_14540 [bacterium]|nr:MAG: hypothetical protein DCC79_14540 [bacterium]